MCELGEVLGMRDVRTPVVAWRWVELGDKGDPCLYPLFRKYADYRIGLPSRAINPYVREDHKYEWIENRGGCFRNGCMGFWAFKTRKQARGWGKRHDFYGNSKNYRIVKVLLQGQMVEHQFGYRSEVMTILEISH